MTDEYKEEGLIRPVLNFGEIITVLYKPEPDILVQCRDTKHGNVYVPLSALIPLIKKQVFDEINRDVRIKEGRRQA